MNQDERLTYLVDYLVEEYQNSDWSEQNFDPDPFSEDTIHIGEKPYSLKEKKRLFQELQNVRPPNKIPQEYIDIQDAYLQEELNNTPTFSINDLESVSPNIYLWKGDITKLEVDAIVNSANSSMLGCWIPGHNCINNTIHTNAGVQLRLRCDELMKEQGFEEPTGSAKITFGYNLPAQYIIHTVGPTVTGEVTQLNRELLKLSYLNCLHVAEEYELQEIAFCCISTGEFAFPQRIAAEIAIETINEYLEEAENPLKIIFNVFTEEEHSIYEELLHVKA